MYMKYFPKPYRKKWTLSLKKKKKEACGQSSVLSHYGDCVQTKKKSLLKNHFYLNAYESKWI